MKVSLESLKSYHKEELARISSKIAAFQQGLYHYDTLALFYGLALAHRDVAILSLVLDDDVNESKKHFYLAYNAYEIDLIKRTDWSLQHYSDRLLCAGVLSDSPLLIQRVGRLWFSDFDAYMRSGAGFFAFGIQQCIQGDWEKLTWLVNELERRINKFKKWEFAVFDKEVFAGILEQNKGRIEAGLVGMTDKKFHRKRSQWDGHPEFISYPAVGYAKLAWLNDIQVESVSPLIPKQLLPIQPLLEYHNYDYLMNETDKHVR